MFVLEYKKLAWNNISSQNRKQKQNFKKLSKIYPYLQAMTYAHTDVFIKNCIKL